MTEFKERYQKPELALDYVSAHHEQKPILYRTVELDERSTLYSHLTTEEAQLVFISHLRENLQNSELGPEDMLVRAIADGESFKFRCFERKSNGDPLINGDHMQHSTIHDALDYIQDIGYEMDGTRFRNGFYSSLREPNNIYARPVWGGDLTVMLIYRNEKHQTIEQRCVGMNTNLPTLRDLLYGVLIIRWKNMS